MAFDIVSVCFGFLIGAASGAAAGYFASKYTDRRRESEAARQAKKQFLSISEQMPKLIAEMRSDLTGEGAEQIREFFVLEDRNVRIGRSEKLRFFYFECEHDNLRGKIDILENAGYIMDVTQETHRSIACPKILLNF